MVNCSFAECIYTVAMCTIPVCLSGLLSHHNPAFCNEVLDIYDLTPTTNIEKQQVVVCTNICLQSFKRRQSICNKTFSPNAQCSVGGNAVKVL